MLLKSDILRHSRFGGINRAVPIFFLFTVLGLFFIMRGETSLQVSEDPPTSHLEFSTVKGIFHQSEDDTNSTQFDFKKQNFGLMNRWYDTDEEFDPDGEKMQWQRFKNYLLYLNKHSPASIQYKVLFMGRHGEGWHNVAEAKYGTKAWDCYWSKLEGADGVTWADANLTELGEGQAKDVHDFWTTHLPEEGGAIPAPETYYVSPLARAIETADITFKALELPHDAPYEPVVKELLREAVGVHTCDRRSSATHIRKTFDSITLEPNFAEEDPLWTTDYREPRSMRKFRMTELLDDVFSNDSGSFISFTSHSGAIASILDAIGHRAFRLETGGVITVLVKAERIDGEREEPPRAPSDPIPTCSVSPSAVPNQ